MSSAIGPTQIKCPQCSISLSIPSHLLGRTVSCPKCSHQFTIPQPVNDSPAEVERRLYPRYLYPESYLYLLTAFGFAGGLFLFVETWKRRGEMRFSDSNGVIVDAIFSMCCMTWPLLLSITFFLASVRRKKRIRANFWHF